MHALDMRTAPGLRLNRAPSLHAEHQQALSSRPLKKAKVALHRSSNGLTQHCPASLKAQAVAEAPASIDITDAPLQQPGLSQQQVSLAARLSPGHCMPGPQAMLTSPLCALQITVVMKFGGSSVANADRMREVAAIMCSFPEQYPCIVLSAMGKVRGLCIGLRRVTCASPDASCHLAHAHH